MSIRPKLVPLIRGAYLDLFVRTFNALGLDVTSDLSQRREPITLPEHRKQYLPALPTLAFVAAVVKQHDIDDFGYLAGTEISVCDFGEEIRRRLGQARTVSDALDGYCRFADREQSHVLCHVTGQTGAEARVHGATAPGPGPELLQYSEWLLIMSLIAIVRHAAGSDWHPGQIAFQSRPALGESVWKAFPGTRFLVGQNEGHISVPQEILGLPWPDSAAAGDNCPMQPVTADLTANCWDFPSSLQAALRPYVREGYPKIELAAELAGLSVRTLQRCLNQCNLRYSGVIKQLRFEIAKELLRDPEKSVLDAACEAGFSDPSHFSRAFRQIADVSPREFRRQQQVA